jgi:hypothetical protein
LSASSEELRITALSNKIIIEDIKFLEETLAHPQSLLKTEETTSAATQTETGTQSEIQTHIS